MTDKNGASSSELVFLPLGGIGEIGMNCYLYGLGPADDRRWLMVDLGITFPGPNEPGVDVILPDIRFAEEERRKIDGLLLTHAHEDHYGAVQELWPRLGVPVYGTAFTLTMLRAKMAERGPNLDIEMIELARNEKHKIGRFNIELIDVAHSIPEPNAVVFHTPNGTVIHTGDWKIDPDPRVDSITNETRFRELGEAGVDALVCDSTNAVRDGISPSEKEVRDRLITLVKQAKHRVALTTFSSNVGRLRTAWECAQESGRDLVVLGRAMQRVIQCAKDTGHLPQDMIVLDQDAAQHLPRDKVLLLLTGSQGEPRAALARIARDDHPDVSLARGDLVIFSSRTIPGNQKSVGGLQNELIEQGIDIITDEDDLVHVTGHPRRDELKQMYAWTRPKTAVPMHGEPRHLKAHGDFAKAQGVETVVRARNGTIVRLLPGPGKIIDDAPVGRLYRDGRMITDSEDIGVRERRKISQVGIAFVTVVLDNKGALACDPDIALDGVPEVDSYGESMEDVALDAIEGALKSIPRGRRRDPDLVGEAVRRATRSALGNAWGKRPIVKVVVSQVGRR